MRLGAHLHHTSPSPHGLKHTYVRVILKAHRAGVRSASFGTILNAPLGLVRKRGGWAAARKEPLTHPALQPAVCQVPSMRVGWGWRREEAPKQEAALPGNL